MAGRVLVLLYDAAPTVGGVQTLYRDALRHARTPCILACAAGPDPAADRAFDRAASCPILRLPLRRRSWLDRLIQKTFLLLGMPYAGFHAVMIRRGFLPLLARARIDAVSLVHVGYHFLAAVGLLVARIRRVPFHLFVHGNELFKMEASPLERLLLRSADRVLVLSDYAAGRCRELGVHNARVRKVRLGMDAPPAPPDRAALRERWSIPGGPVLLTLSRLERRKGVDVLLEAIAGVRDEFPGLTCLIAGTGGQAARLREKAGELGLRDTVRFLGRVSDAKKEELFALADLFALVPRTIPEEQEVEGFGIVFLEAARCGVAVLAGRSGGVEDAVVDNVTGLLVDPLSVAEVRDNLARLLRDEGLRRRLGEAGRRRVETLFTWEGFEAAAFRP